MKDFYDIKAVPPAKLYVLSVYLTSGPISDKFPSKVIRRDIEIRGDQTLEDLHNAIFQAYDRWEAHAYEFQMGKRPFDPEGPNYGIADPDEKKPNHGDARTTTLDDLDLQKRKQTFGYWFDFGDDWFHQIQVERVEEAISTVHLPACDQTRGQIASPVHEWLSKVCGIIIHGQPVAPCGRPIVR